MLTQPHAINIMKGIDQASKRVRCADNVIFMKCEQSYTAQLYPPDTSIGWDYQKKCNL